MTVEENADPEASNRKPTEDAADGTAGDLRPAAISPALLLMMLGRQMREKTDAELRNQGLSLRHLSALGHLAHQPGLSYSELARRDGITAQSMQSTLLQLQEIGAVERLTAPGRGRTADLQVTPSGQALLDRGRAVLEAADQRLLDAIGNENADLIAQFALRALTAMNEWQPAQG